MHTCLHVSKQDTVHLDMYHNRTLTQAVQDLDMHTRQCPGSGQPHTLSYIWTCTLDTVQHVDSVAGCPGIGHAHWTRYSMWTVYHSRTCTLDMYHMWTHTHTVLVQDMSTWTCMYVGHACTVYRNRTCTQDRVLYVDTTARCPKCGPKCIPMY